MKGAVPYVAVVAPGLEPGVDEVPWHEGEALQWLTYKTMNIIIVYWELNPDRRFAMLVI